MATQTRIFDNNFPLQIMPYSQEDIDLHAHDFCELVLIVDGTGAHITPEETYSISCGDTFLVTPGYEHGYNKTKGLKLYNIMYLPTELGLPQQDLEQIPGYYAFFKAEPRFRSRHRFKSRLTLDERQLSEIVDITRKMEWEIKREKPGYRFFAISHLMQLIGNISRYYSESGNSQSKELFILSEILSFIEKNYNRQLYLTDLAASANMSASTLNRIFQRSIGQAPMEYLLHFRLQKAALMLRDGKERITEIAYSSGFSDSNYFSSQFRNTFGSSPREYRKSFAKEK